MTYFEARRLATTYWNNLSWTTRLFRDRELYIVKNTRWLIEQTNLNEQPARPKLRIVR